MAHSQPFRTREYDEVDRKTFEIDTTTGNLQQRTNDIQCAGGRASYDVISTKLIMRISWLIPRLRPVEPPLVYELTNDALVVGVSATQVMQEGAPSPSTGERPPAAMYEWGLRRRRKAITQSLLRNRLSSAEIYSVRRRFVLQIQQEGR